MTSPQSQTGRDDDGEHRTIGQRIRDAVLGDPEDDARRDTYGDTTRDGGYAEGTRRDDGYTDASRDTARADDGYIDAAGDTTRADDGYTDAARADAGHAGTESVRDTARSDVAPHEHARPEDHLQAGAVPAGSGTTSGVSYSDAGRDTATTGTRRDDDVRPEEHLQAGAVPAGSGTGTTSGAGYSDAGRPADETATRDYDSRDYDASTDTGYLDEDRAGTDRTTGRRDADYDTGRVDRDGSAEYRDTRPGAGTVGAVAAGGAAAAGIAGAAATHRDNEPGDRSGARFSDVDDTATVDRSGTGRASSDGGVGVSSSGQPAVGTLANPTGSDTAAHDTRAAEHGSDAVGRADDTSAAGRAAAVSEDNRASDDDRERLVPVDRAQEYSSRWDSLKGDFVDEPRRAVTQADELVKEVLDEINDLFANQRRDLEQGFDHDKASTEDLRVALRRYRSFFDRLLSL